MAERPNILVLFGEQHRGDALSSDGHPTVLTPNIDSIGGNGCRFTSAYSSCPVCVAARRSLISGQFPATHGAFKNINKEWDIEKTLPRVFRDNGYQSGWVGRSMHQYPARKRFGFEEMVIQDHRCHDDYDTFMRRNMSEGEYGYYGSGVMHNDWTARPFHLPEHLHATNWTIHEAQRFLDRRDPARPFFLVASFIAAHPPLIPPAFYMERYLRKGVNEPAIGDWETPPDYHTAPSVSCKNVDLTDETLLSARAGYYGLINHLDDQIRRLMHGIQGGVSLQNTVIVYLADHGELLGDHYLWRKQHAYEGSARVPMLIRTPPSFGFQRGVVCDEPVCLEDLMPTLLELADVPVPETVEGRSLVPLLRGEQSNWRPWVHIEYQDLHQTLTDGKEKYIWFTRDGSEQYFDLRNDPQELHDASEDPDKIENVRLWRRRLIEELSGRPEGFTDGESLIPQETTG